MLKVVSTKQVRLGMFIHELKGSWIDHPFWKKAFKLEDSTDLKKLHASAIKEVVIDTSKGLDVLQEVALDKPNEQQLPISKSIEEPQAIHQTVQVKRVTAAEERVRAKQVISASRKAVTSMFNDARMGKAIKAEAAMQFVDDIADSVSRNEGALISLVRLKTKDDYTYMHSVAVCALMVALAKELGMSESDVKQAGLAGLLHDIGKAAVPIDVLNKPGALTDDEFSVVKLHPERGHELLIQANITDPVTLDVCLHHHEKVNGTGYPHRLQGDAISLFARMGAVCDVYDAVTSNRPYKDGWEPGVSLQRMAQWAGHFDDVVFKAFVKSVGIYPIGSMVKLKSGRLAVVIDQSTKSLLTPIVKVFFSTKSKTRLPVEILDLSKGSANDAIVGHEDPTFWGVHDVDKLWAE
ncbi:HD-GYP domain-containing protein [Methylotenera sp.]|uniref:HD-GYP domain-containing protein n=1 Tax=Methylotenera sp. TaxID=2051956 RepID=UPI002733202A|nr:HD-GYP domain-containing protein [Methylotenera sp.]MDP3777745.1 HD-GYP domain-containing protein [Methylotenera sp.]